VKFRSETGRFDGGTRARVTARLVYYCVHYGWHFSEVPVVACVLGMLNVLESSRSSCVLSDKGEEDVRKKAGNGGTKIRSDTTWFQTARPLPGKGRCAIGVVGLTG
jgi:hypothetical protein